jgi:excisionase family DNA binding protein
MLEGAIYTVDEVSDLLGIPRPTLYRYLREYSIPHLRRSGRISIPEDSFDRIREARDLHKEGLGTESVRRQLREGRGPDTVELDRRLDHLHETLEDLRGDLKDRPATDEVALSPTLRTILARQSLLISAMFNLTGMVEDLLLASGKRRKPLFEDLRAGLHEPLPKGRVGDRLAIQAAVPTTATSISAAAHDGNGPVFLDRSAHFGTLGQRRRRGALALLSVLLVALCLTWAVPALTGASGPETSTTGAAQQAGQPSGGTPPRGEDPKAIAGEAISADETTARGTPAETTTEPAQVATADTEPEGGVVVPEVSHRRMGEAAQTLTDAGLEVASIRDETSQERPGTVIGTIPAAGTSVESGTPMTLRVSVGPPGSPSGTHGASTSTSASASASSSANAAAYASASPATSASASASSSSVSSSSASASSAASVGSASASASPRYPGN